MAHEAAHAHHLANDGADVPDEVRQSVMNFLDDAATYTSREDLMQAISAAYAAVGVWEEFLESHLPEEGDHA